MATPVASSPPAVSPTSPATLEPPAAKRSRASADAPTSEMMPPQPTSSQQSVERDASGSVTVSAANMTVRLQLLTSSTTAAASAHEHAFAAQMTAELNPAQPASAHSVNNSQLILSQPTSAHSVNDSQLILSPRSSGRRSQPPRRLDGFDLTVTDRSASSDSDDYVASSDVDDSTFSEGAAPSDGSNRSSPVTYEYEWPTVVSEPEFLSVSPVLPDDSPDDSDGSRPATPTTSPPHLTANSARTRVERRAYDSFSQAEITALLSSAVATFPDSVTAHALPPKDGATSLVLYLRKHRNLILAVWQGVFNASITFPDELLKHWRDICRTSTYVPKIKSVQAAVADILLMPALARASARSAETHVAEAANEDNDSCVGTLLSFAVDDPLFEDVLLHVSNISRLGYLAADGVDNGALRVWFPTILESALTLTEALEANVQAHKDFTQVDPHLERTAFEFCVVLAAISSGARGPVNRRRVVAQEMRRRFSIFEGDPADGSCNFDALAEYIQQNRPPVRSEVKDSSSSESDIDSDGKVRRQLSASKLAELSDQLRFKLRDASRTLKQAAGIGYRLANESALARDDVIRGHFDFDLTREQLLVDVQRELGALREQGDGNAFQAFVEYLTDERVSDGFKHIIRNDSSGGTNGVAASVWKSLLDFDASAGKDSGRLLAVLTRMARCAASGYWVHCLCGGRAYGLVKGSKTRAITSPDIVFNVVAYLGTQYAESVGAVPVDDYGRQKNGAARAYHAVYDHIQGNGTVIIKSDFADAFNMMNRSAVLRIYRQRCPALVMFSAFRFSAYNISVTPREMVAFVSMVGSPQGGGLSPLDMALLISEARREATRQFTDKFAGVPPPAFVSVADDTSTLTSVDTFVRDAWYFRFFAFAAGDVGLVLRIPKCDLLIHAADEECFDATRFEMLTRGAEIFAPLGDFRVVDMSRSVTTFLGLPLGVACTPAFTLALEHSCEKTVELVDVVDEYIGGRDPLGTRIALERLVLPRTTYASRALPPSEAFTGALSTVDDAVRESVAASLHDTVGNLSKHRHVFRLVQIPAGKGGFGLRSPLKLCAVAYVASRLSTAGTTLASVEEEFGTLYSVYAGPLGMSVEDLRDLFQTTPSQRVLTSKLLDAYNVKMVTDYFATVDGMTGMLGMLAATRGLITSPMTLSRLAAESARLMVRFRLAALVNHTTGGYCGFRHDQLCSLKNDVMDPASSHPFSCGGARRKGAYNGHSLHNGLRDGFHTAALKLGYRNVAKERPLTNGRNDERLRMDVTYAGATGEMAVDATLFATEDFTLHAIEEKGDLVTKEKRAKYGPLLNQVGVTEGNFHVLACTNTGYFTRASMDFLRSFFKNAPDPGGYTLFDMLSSFFVHVARSLVATLRKTLSA